MVARIGQVWTGSNDSGNPTRGAEASLRLLKFCNVISCRHSPHSWLSARIRGVILEDEEAQVIRSPTHTELDTHASATRYNPFAYAWRTRNGRRPWRRHHARAGRSRDEYGGALAIQPLAGQFRTRGNADAAAHSSPPAAELSADSRSVRLTGDVDHNLIVGDSLTYQFSLHRCAGGNGNTAE